MSHRSFDVIVFGATGFLGRRITKFIYENSILKRWAIMGRSHTKLSALMTQLRDMNIIGVLPDLLIADAQDFRSLRDIFVEARLMLNCVRPYRTMGKDIIEACILARCDYMDLCSESLFIESNFLEFHSEAQKKSVFIVHACGFDAAISNLGMMYTLRNFSPDECNSVESFLTIHAPQGLTGDFSTYETLLNNQKEQTSLKKLRAKIDETFRTPVLTYPGPRIAKKTEYTLDKRIDKYVLPNFGSDLALMNQGIRTLSLNGSSGSSNSNGGTITTTCSSWPQYHPYLAVNDYYSATTTAFYTSVCNTLASFSMGRYLLRAFPEAFSDGIFSNTSGPSEEQLRATSFHLQFIARGFAVLSEDITRNILTEEQKLLRKQESNNPAATSTSAAEGGENKLGLSVEQEEQHIQLYEASNNGRNKFNRTIIPRNDLNETIVVEALNSTMCGTVFGSGGGGDTEGDKQRCTYNNDLTAKVPIEMRVSVSGPEPYHVTSCAVAVMLALCLVEEREAQRARAVNSLGVMVENNLDSTGMPEDTIPEGGVFTPLSAFYHSKEVFAKMKDIGVEFKVHSGAQQAANNESNREQEPSVPHVVDVNFIDACAEGGGEGGAAPADTATSPPAAAAPLVADLIGSGREVVPTTTTPTTNPPVQLPATTSATPPPLGQLESIEASFFANRTQNPVTAVAHMA